MTRSLFLFLIFPVSLYSQVNPGPRITALGTSGVALQDVWSMQSNQAGIAAIQKFTVAVAYENEYFNPELSRQSAVIVFPYKHNAFSISFQDYGFDAYNEQRAAFAYARNFSDKLFAAMNFNFHQLKIGQYGSAAAYSAEVGLQYFLNEKLLLGAHISNPNRSAYSSDINAFVPVSIEFGASYHFTQSALINSGIIKTLESTTDIRTGIEYSVKWLDARGGFSANPFRQYVGLGFNRRDLHIDAAVSTHPVLGYSPQIGISYEF